MNDNFYRSSGVAIAIRRISEALQEVECSFASCTNENLPEELSWIPAGTFQRFNLKSSSPTRLFRELIRFKKWYNSQGCDLIHCHHRRVAVLMQLAGLPVLYTGQLTFDESAWFRWLHPRRMTAITPSVATNLLETTGRKVLACIGNPAEFPKAPPEIDVRSVQFRAACVARLDRIKGHSHLLSAWRILKDRGYKYELDLVGEGPLRAELEAQVKRECTEDQIRFCGFTCNVGSILQKCLFTILVSSREGQGIVTLEAAASGRPSLLTAVPGSVDLLPPQRRLPNGLPFGDPLVLANALEKWFADPAAVVEEGKRFFSFLKSSSDPTAIGKEYKALYEQILAKSV